MQQPMELYTKKGLCGKGDSSTIYDNLEYLVKASSGLDGYSSAWFEPGLEPIQGVITRFEF